MRPLTPRQEEVLQLIKTTMSETGMPPTRAEIARQLGFKSANALLPTEVNKRAANFRVRPRVDLLTAMLLEECTMSAIVTGFDWHIKGM